MNELITYATPALIVFIAWILDRLFADPNTSLHPIVVFGKSISFCEKRLNKGNNRLLKGGAMSIALIGFVFAFFAVTDHYITQASTVAGAVYSIIGLYFCIAGTTLIREVVMVFDALDRGLDEGRKQVSRIVGRDTSELSEEEVKKAALETLAENLSDGVIAPLFWYALFGIAGAMTYKMINTLDSMIGYQNDRYILFGRVAAKIDDVANYIPARITALLMLIVSGNSSKIDFVKRFGKAHASPNSGYPEAALAGILGCRFGGSHHYFGQLVYKPFIGEEDRVLTKDDLSDSVRVSRRTETVWVILTAMARVALVAVGI